ncbi:MAG: nuclear transport factor 2 family protein [Saprospiraceae bacterium]|nr:nuclear transport factor 2 family protein [Saprospiraceae bacterium]
MKKSLLFVFSLLFFSQLTAQTATDSVKTTINNFFDGMKSGDTTLIKSTLTEGVIFQTIGRTKEGTPMVKTENVSDFLASIGKMEKGVADERITFKTIEIDGTLASVWTPYQFYFKGQFSHCGANSFQLVKIEGNWRIQYIIDTRRKKGCE